MCQTVNQTVCNLCQHRVKCWSSAEVVLVWCGAVLLLLFGASVASLRLVLLFPWEITHRVFSSFCLCLTNIFHIELLFYYYCSLRWKIAYFQNKLFLPIWCILAYKCGHYFINVYSVIVKCFILTALQNILYNSLNEF